MSRSLAIHDMAQAASRTGHAAVASSLTKRAARAAVIEHAAPRPAARPTNVAPHVAEAALKATVRNALSAPSSPTAPAQKNAATPSVAAPAVHRILDARNATEKASGHGIERVVANAALRARGVTTTKTRTQHGLVASALADLRAGGAR